MQSWERAVFSPRFLGVLYKTGSKESVEAIGWQYPLGHHVSAKYRRQLFFWFCPMRRRSLHLLSPDRLHNSDGDTGTFFRVKNYRREFLRENRRLERGWYRPPSYLLEGTCQGKRGLRWIFMEEYGKIT